MHDGELLMPDAECPASDCTPRLVVVIDPESQADTLALAEAHLVANPNVANMPALIADRMQAALREFANPTPPKPEEPTGLGAVVEDAEGVRWLSVGAQDGGEFRWARDGQVVGSWRKYADIAPVRVLSGGWSE